MPRKYSKKTPNSGAADPCRVDWGLLTAVRALTRGEVIAHATEAVFGLAARAYDAAACARIARLKSRPARKSFIVVGSEVAQIARLVTLETPFRREILASWPGPHTWVLPAARTAPRWLRDNRGRIAVRVTAHPQTAALCRRAGLLVSTSANPAGRSPARTVLAARGYFRDAIAAYLGGRPGPARRPTTIRDGTTGKVIRA